MYLNGSFLTQHSCPQNYYPKTDPANKPAQGSLVLQGWAAPLHSSAGREHPHQIGIKNKRAPQHQLHIVQPFFDTQSTCNFTHSLSMLISDENKDLRLEIFQSGNPTLDTKILVRAKGKITCSCQKKLKACTSSDTQDLEQNNREPKKQSTKDSLSATSPHFHLLQCILLT